MPKEENPIFPASFFPLSFSGSKHSIKINIENAYMKEYHVGVNSYSIEIENESESEKLMFKRLNRKKKDKIVIYKIVLGVKVHVSGYRV